MVYKEALIDLVSTLEESRQFIQTFTKEKSRLRKLQDACYANKVKVQYVVCTDILCQQLRFEIALKLFRFETEWADIVPAITTAFPPVKR